LKNILNHNIMGLIREPLDVDFTVEPKVLTKAEKDAISEYIRNYKTKEDAAKNFNKKEIRLSQKKERGRNINY
jgi:hypothetical protein